MKKILLYTTLLLSVSLLFSACDEKGPDKPDNTDTETIQLATPVLELAWNTRTSFTVTWEPIERAASYIYTLNGTEEFSTYETSATFSGLEPGTYAVAVKAVAGIGSGYSDSEWGSLVYDLTGNSDNEENIPDAYKPWMGDWTVRTTSSLVWTEDETTAHASFSSGLSFNVEIVYDYEKECAAIRGFCQYNVAPHLMPAYGYLNDEGQLELRSGIELDDASLAAYLVPQGYACVWLGVIDYNGTPSPVNGSYTAYTLTMQEDGTIAGEPNTITINVSGGESASAEIKAYDITGFNASQGYWYYIATQSPGGSMTFTKLE